MPLHFSGTQAATKCLFLLSCAPNPRVERIVLSFADLNEGYFIWIGGASKRVIVVTVSRVFHNVSFPSGHLGGGTHKEPVSDALHRPACTQNKRSKARWSAPVYETVVPLQLRMHPAALMRISGFEIIPGSGDQTAAYPQILLMVIG